MTTTTKEISQKSRLLGSTAHYTFLRDFMVMNLFGIANGFGKYYPNVKIAYSFKTNYLKAAIETASDMHCMAEVVSPYELEYARKTGLFRDNEIVYNGVIPDPAGKFEIAAAGGIVNVDNIDEYHALSAIAEENGIEIGIGVRVNFDIGNDIYSRFGMDVEGHEYSKTIREIQNDKFIRLNGLHCHIGTSRPVKYWRNKISKMLSAAQGLDLKYIDLGGGMYGPMQAELASQFTDYASSFDEYGDAVGKAMRKAFPNADVTLILEPGTAAVGNAFVLDATVVNIKEARGETFITLNCNSNHIGMLCECRDIPMTVFHDGKEPVEVKDATVVGNTCLEFDYIKKRFSGSIAVGDTVRFCNVGAYSLSESRQFIVPRLAVLDIEGNVLKKAEGFIEMLGSYI